MCGFAALWLWLCGCGCGCAVCDLDLALTLCGVSHCVSHFCKMDIATGVVSPVSPKGDYVTAAQGVVQWYPTGVLYSAGNAHSSGPVAGDMLFFEFSTNVSVYTAQSPCLW